MNKSSFVPQIKKQDTSDSSEILNNPLGQRFVFSALFYMIVAYSVSLGINFFHNSYSGSKVFLVLSGISLLVVLNLTLLFRLQKIDSNYTISYIAIWNVIYICSKLFYVCFINYDPVAMVYLLSSDVLYASCGPMLAYSMAMIPLSYSLIWLQGHFFTLVFLVSFILGRNQDLRELYSLLQLALVYWMVLLAVSTYSKTIRRLWRAKRENIMLTQIVYQDELTGLPNRRGMENQLNELVSTAEEEDFEIALLFVDLDGFKPINDTLGHQVGDEILKNIAKRMEQHCQKWATVSRINGDEFVILTSLNEIDENIIREYAFSLHDYLNRPIIAFGQQIEMTASIGISLYPRDGKTGQDLLRRADIAMLSVKKSGKNAVQFYGSDLHSDSEYNQVLLREIVGVQSREELHLVFQPIYDLKTGQIHSCEALLRWNHPLLGYISPQAFIPLAENSGMIIPIGQWILSQALGAVVQLRKQGLSNARVAVNISPLQLIQADFFNLIQHELNKHSVRGDVLELEITEGLEISNRPAIIDLLNRLQDIGVQIALDDFGEGFASLSHLRDLPLNTVKLDRSFVAGLDSDNTSTVLYAKALIQAAVHLANTLGIKVVAEGIENKEQLKFLIEMGCHYGQGYHLMYPIKLEKLLNETHELLKSEKS